MTANDEEQEEKLQSWCTFGEMENKQKTSWVFKEESWVLGGKCLAINTSKLDPLPKHSK